MSSIPIWPGSGSAISQSTSFGFYDTDSQFQTDGPNVAKWVCRRLGYPVISVELQDVEIYDCFEEAITEYSAQVNQFRIRDNMLMLIGSSTGSNFSQQDITPNLGRIVKIAEAYGTEAGVGGDIDIKSGSFRTVVDQQVYDLDELWTNVSESGNTIEIVKLHHYAPPSIVRYFDPYAGTGTGMQSLMTEFGWGGMSPAINFVLMPIFADVLRIQAIEFNDQIRRSGYSFSIVNNKLRIFPIPTEVTTIHFDYIVKEDKINPLRGSVGTVSDYSNVAFDLMTYSNINQVGKQWIRRYAYILAKNTLGHIRSKYVNIPIPGSEVTLNGPDLISEASTEKEAALTELRETLEAISKKTQMEMEKEVSDNLRETLANIPLGFYVG